MSNLSPLAKRNLDKALQLLARRGNDEATAIVQGALRPITGGGTSIPVSALPYLAGDATGPAGSNVVGKIQTFQVSSVAPAQGQVLVWDDTAAAWIPGAPGTPTGSVIDYTTLVNEALTGSGATATASSTYSGVTGTTGQNSVASHLVDNDEDTYWRSDPGPAGGPFNGVDGEWARVDLGSAKAITYFRIGGGFWAGFGPPTWKVQSSPDGTTWTDRYSGTGDIETGYVSLSGTFTYRYWRMLATSEAAEAPSSQVYWAVRTFGLYSGAPLVQAPGHTIEDEGTPQNQRTNLNFVGAGVTVTDDSGNDATVVTVPGSGLTRYATDIGDGASTTITVTHNLGTRDVIVQVRKVASTYDYVECDIKAASTTTVTLTFAVAPTTNQYRVICIG